MFILVRQKVFGGSAGSAGFAGFAGFVPQTIFVLLLKEKEDDKETGAATSY